MTTNKGIDRMPSFIGFWELMALAAVLLLLFGPRRLPEIGRSLGKGMREFKESVTTPLAGEPTGAPIDARFEEAPGAPRQARAAMRTGSEVDSVLAAGTPAASLDIELEADADAESAEAA